MRIALIPCGRTEWRDEGRLLGRVEVPLLPGSHEICGEWLTALQPLGLERIYHAPDELASQTALLLAKRLSVPAKPLPNLAEVDVGLWAGLTDEQLRARFATAHRELCEAPLNVVPPEGEGLADAAERLSKCVGRQIRKSGSAAIGIITRPLGLAMIKCVLEGRGFADVWEAAQSPDEVVVLDSDPTPGARRPPRGTAAA